MTTYPLNLPAQGIGGIVIRKADVAGLSVSPYTGAQESVAYPGQWWEADVTFATASMAAAGAIEAFLGQLKGSVGTFLMGDPMRPVPFGLAASSPGTPVCDGIQAQYADTLNIKNGGVSKVKYLLAGDYIQLGTAGNTHLHQVLVDADTDGAGKTTLSIWPALRAAVADGDTVTVTACKGLFRLFGSKRAITRRPGPFTDCGFTAMEAL